jgi:hypothetical protein
MQNKANKDLYDLISALSGTSDFTSGEVSHLLALSNRRMYEAYNRTPYWARYLVTGESRPVASSIVNFEETSGYTPIGEFLRIHRTDPFVRNSAIEYEFYIQSDGAHILNLTTAETSEVFVTYKKRLTELTDLDIDGSNSRTEVPQEFFYFMAHATYADFLRLDGQHQKAVLEDQIAEKYLGEEMDNPQQVSNNNTVGKRFKTYVSQQAR